MDVEHHILYHGCVVKCMFSALIQSVGQQDRHLAV